MHNNAFNALIGIYYELMTYWKYIHLTELSEAVCSSWAVSKMTRYLTAAWYVASRGIEDYHTLTIDMSRYAF